MQSRTVATWAGWMKGSREESLVPSNQGRKRSLECDPTTPLRDKNSTETIKSSERLFMCVVHIGLAPCHALSWPAQAEADDATEAQKQRFPAVCSCPSVDQHMGHRDKLV